MAGERAVKLDAVHRRTVLEAPAAQPGRVPGRGDGGERPANTGDEGIRLDGARELSPFIWACGSVIVTW